MKTYQPSEGLSALKNKGVEGLPRDHNLQVIKLVVFRRKAAVIILLSC